MKKNLSSVVALGALIVAAVACGKKDDVQQAPTPLTTSQGAPGQAQVNVPQTQPTSAAPVETSALIGLWTIDSTICGGNAKLDLKKSAYHFETNQSGYFTTEDGKYYSKVVTFTYTQNGPKLLLTDFSEITRVSNHANGKSIRSK